MLRWDTSRSCTQFSKLKGKKKIIPCSQNPCYDHPYLSCSSLGSGAQNMQCAAVQPSSCILFLFWLLLSDECGLLRELENLVWGQFLGKTVEVAQLSHWIDSGSPAVIEDGQTIPLSLEWNLDAFLNSILWFFHILITCFWVQCPFEFGSLLSFFFFFLNVISLEI